MRPCFTARGPLPCLSWRAACAIVALLLAVCGPAEAQIKVEPAKHGIEALHYNGWQYLTQRSFYDSDLTLKAIYFQDENGKPVKGDHELVSVKTRQPGSKRHVVRMEYEWGRIEADYRWGGDRLDLRLRVDNRSDRTIARLSMDLAGIHFPQTPEGYEGGGVHLDANIGGPSVIGAAFEDGVLAVCNERIGEPLILGYRWAIDNSEWDEFLLRLSAGPNGWLSPYIDNKVRRPIPAGGSDRYHISLRFGGPDETVASLTEDLYERYRQRYPFQLGWPDRRPIGQAFLSSAAEKFHSKTNPQGWFRKPELDVLGEDGHKRFRERLMAFADSLIGNSKKLHSQGVIVWDMEGQQMPHAISYIGDPRALPEIAPMMDAAADDFFARLKDAGLRTGVTIRPQRIVRTPDGKHARTQKKVDDPAAEMIDKIDYARDRWGCTLFYIDSNGNPNAPMRTEVFREVREAHPDVLLIPESHWTDYHGFTIPYDSSPAPQRVRRLYPQAVRAISMGQYGQKPEGAKRRRLIEAAERGAIFFVFSQWHGRKMNTWARNLLKEAGRWPPEAPGKK